MLHSPVSQPLILTLVALGAPVAQKRDATVRLALQLILIRRQPLLSVSILLRAEGEILFRRVLLRESSVVF